MGIGRPQLGKSFPRILSTGWHFTLHSEFTISLGVCFRETCSSPEIRHQEPMLGGCTSVNT